MPELPEVESIRRSLEPLVVGRRIERARIDDPRLVRPKTPSELEAQLEGERIEALGRRGKYLLIELESGLTLTIHLRMTGSLRLRPADGDDLRFEHARLELDDRMEIAYCDMRRFGTWRLLAPDELDEYLGERVGPEPFSDEFTPGFLRRRFDDRAAPLKAAILDQRTAAGLGNVYADEALWWARLHPERPAGSLSPGAVGRLRDSIRKALEIGIARQGVTLRDYVLPDGGLGSMQLELRVYGHDGEPCERCGTEIEKTRVAGRGTWYCPHCQRR
jgi:formamidopyrimidine-DNA glycosylase